MKKIIVLSVATVAILTFSGCGGNNKEETKTTTVEKTQTATEATKEAAAKTVEAAKETASKAAEATKEVAQKATESAKEAVKEVADKAKEAASKTVEAAKETAKEATESAKEAVAQAADKAKEAVTEAADKAKEAVAGNTNAKGEAIYKKCISCHGADGKTKALGKSEIIAAQSAEELVKKMQEYKAGTRNVAGMGALMKGQVANLSDEDIKAVADYISNLK